jgi:dihydroorotase
MSLNNAPTSSPADLVISAGRVIDPVTGADAPGWVAVVNGLISATGGANDTAPAASNTLNCPDGILLPGLIDLHAHPGLDDGRYGIDPDIHMLPRGSTTLLSQGDAGARNWDSYRERVIEDRKTRTRMALHIGRNGEINPEGPFTKLEYADADECIATIQSDDSGAIWGITVNTSVMTCGPSDPHEVLRRALIAAEKTELPLLFGPRRAPGWALEDQLPLLRPGDVFTYCSDPSETTIVRDGHVRECVREARERGILFDLGHGQIAINYEALEVMVAEDFLPDAISSDLYSFHLGLEQPHDLPHVMSKMRAVGMTETQIWSRVTIRPAQILGMEDEIGTLNPGACADISVLRWDDSPYVHADLEGNDRTGGMYLPVVTIRGGEVFEPLA